MYTILFGYCDVEASKFYDVIGPSRTLRNHNYFGGARSKGFATLRNVSKLPFFDKIGQVKSGDIRLYSAI